MVSYTLHTYMMILTMMIIATAVTIIINARLAIEKIKLFYPGMHYTPRFFFQTRTLSITNSSKTFPYTLTSSMHSFLYRSYIPRATSSISLEKHLCTLMRIYIQSSTEPFVFWYY